MTAPAQIVTAKEMEKYFGLMGSTPIEKKMFITIEKAVELLRELRKRIEGGFSQDVTHLKITNFLNQFDNAPGGQAS